MGSFLALFVILLLVNSTFAAYGTAKVKDLTGPGITARFSMQATDLGIPLKLANGQILFIFGDTFRDARVGSPDWRSPVGLVSDGNWTGVNWIRAAGPNPNYAAQLLPYTHGVGFSTVLPADTINIGGKIYMWCMVNNGLGNVLWSEIQVSSDNGNTWKHSGTKVAGGHLGGMLQLITWVNGGDGHIYIYSTGFQRNKPIIMHRVPENQILNINAWQPWGYANGQWKWGNPPTPILGGNFGEMALRKVENKFVFLWFNAGDYRMDALVLNSPVDNLVTAPRHTLIWGGAWGREDNTHVAQLYGGYIIPGSTLRNFHFVVSQWNTGTGWPYRSMQWRTSLV